MFTSSTSPTRISAASMDYMLNPAALPAPPPRRHSLAILGLVTSSVFDLPLPAALARRSARRSSYDAYRPAPIQPRKPVVLPPCVFVQDPQAVSLPPMLAMLHPSVSGLPLPATFARNRSFRSAMSKFTRPSTTILPPLVLDQTAVVLPSFNTIATMLPPHPRPTKVPHSIVAHEPVAVAAARFASSSRRRLSEHLFTLKRTWRTGDSCEDMSVAFLIAPLASNEQ